MQQSFHFFLLLFITAIIYPLFLSTDAYSFEFPSFEFPSANISTKWINRNPKLLTTLYDDGVITRHVLLRNTSGIEFGCGFICPVGSDPSASCKSFLFSIFLSTDPVSPRIVWSANRERLVRENATLEFFKNGDLVLRDFDGTLVWSTATSGKSVVGMELNEVASLVLFDKKNNTIWSSMDYPTDSLVLGQTLQLGKRLTANVSPTNSSQGPLYLTVNTYGIQGFVGSQLYYSSSAYPEKPTYVSFNNGSLGIFANAKSWNVSKLPVANSVQYMQQDYRGHLKVYEWHSTEWVPLKNVFDEFLRYDECRYPMVCGEYGICSNGQCSCPSSDDDIVKYFRPVDQRNTDLGCVPLNPLSCSKSAKAQLLSLNNMNYFSTYLRDAYMKNTNATACKQACLANCSCKAAIFMYDIDDGPDASSGSCYQLLELYSLKKSVLKLSYYSSSSAFIKVQSFPNTNSTSSAINTNVLKGKKVSTIIIVAASVGALLFFLAPPCAIAFVMRRHIYGEGENGDELDMLPGLPTRFAFEDLRVATNDFLRKLGAGGFGSVFEGTLIDGTKIAVKRLDGIGQGTKEFLSEVETIGSINHIHLVKLIGFCAEKVSRLLVYEYMSNGSLDKWIFYKNHDIILDWQTRRKIIHDIAKGLAYLHNDCRQKIVHLDIKPQNILLDENFNAKVSDFGLAKLINRDQIEVMTRMRGTPGYLAPEWLTSVITEKVDVFSFGVVVLEIICGRRNLDRSKDEEDFHLIGVLQRKVQENKLVDMLDFRCTSMQTNIKDVIMIMHLAMWCLQSDSNKRPLMSVVLKVLEGSMNVEADLDYDFLSITHASKNANIVESVQPIPSILSGPR